MDKEEVPNDPCDEWKWPPMKKIEKGGLHGEQYTLY